ncbi:MAG: imidazoleglycerol-phosphate dehydratase HisB [Verrucomicrobiota bacterium]
MAEDNLTRSAQRERKTKETEISLGLLVDGSGQAEVDTGIAFLDHMLELFARHGLFDVTVKASGDLDVDYHHTVEDLGIVLGEALKEALGDKKGIVRYGFFILPMDETLVRVALDLSNRPLMVYQVETPVLMVRDFNIGLLKEFFQALTNSAGMNLHIKLEYGEEPHHVAEAIFKGFARALDMATRVDPRQADSLPSTKGLLT